MPKILAAFSRLPFVLANVSVMACFSSSSNGRPAKPVPILSGEAGANSEEFHASTCTFLYAIFSACKSYAFSIRPDVEFRSPNSSG